MGVLEVVWAEGSASRGLLLPPCPPVLPWLLPPLAAKMAEVGGTPWISSWTIGGGDRPSFQMEGGGSSMPPMLLPIMTIKMKGGNMIISIQDNITDYREKRLLWRERGSAPTN